VAKENRTRDTKVLVVDQEITENAHPDMNMEKNDQGIGVSKEAGQKHKKNFISNSDADQEFEYYFDASEFVAATQQENADIEGSTVGDEVNQQVTPMNVQKSVENRQRSYDSKQRERHQGSTNSEKVSMNEQVARNMQFLQKILGHSMKVRKTTRRGG